MAADGGTIYDPAATPKPKPPAGDAEQYAVFIPSGKQQINCLELGRCMLSEHLNGQSEQPLAICVKQSGDYV